MLDPTVTLNAQFGENMYSTFQDRVNNIRIHNASTTTV